MAMAFMLKRILFADDEADVRKVVGILLERAGYHVSLFEDESFVKVTEANLLPDLFLLDRRLGNIDALKLCPYLKSHPRTSHIPIVIVSADPAVSGLYKTAGADDFIAKPFDINSFLEKVALYVNKEGAAVKRSHI